MMFLACLSLWLTFSDNFRTSIECGCGSNNALEVARGDEENWLASVSSPYNVCLESHHWYNLLVLWNQSWKYSHSILTHTLIYLNYRHRFFLVAAIHWLTTNWAFSSCNLLFSSFNSKRAWADFVWDSTEDNAILFPHIQLLKRNNISCYYK